MPKNAKKKNKRTKHAIGRLCLRHRHEKLRLIIYLDEMTRREVKDIERRWQLAKILFQMPKINLAVAPESFTKFLEDGVIASESVNSGH